MISLLREEEPESIPDKRDTVKHARLCPSHDSTKHQLEMLLLLLMMMMLEEEGGGVEGE